MVAWGQFFDKEFTGQWQLTCRRFTEIGITFALARAHWNQLTDDDLPAVEGNIEQLVGRIQAKTGEGREAIEKFFSDMTSRGESAVAYGSEAARRYAHQASDQIRERYDRAEGLVRHHPTETVLAAFGIGLVAGVITALCSAAVEASRVPHRNATVASQRKSPMNHPVVVTFLILAAMMRSVPYAGAAVAFLLALVFSIAYFDGWRQPLEVAALFGVVEVALSYLEPVIYGKTTGVSALAGCWLQRFSGRGSGLLGTLLSTPHDALPGGSRVVAGVAASGTSDALTLRMLGQILAPSSCTLVNIEGAVSPMQLAERVAKFPGNGHPVASSPGGPCTSPLSGPAAPLAVLSAGHRGGALGRGRQRGGVTGALRRRGDARGLHTGRCPRPDPGQGRFRGSGDAGNGEYRDDQGLSRTEIPGDHPTGGLSIEEAASNSLSISAAARRTRATTQNQNNSTITPPSAPNDLL